MWHAPTAPCKSLHLHSKQDTEVCESVHHFKTLNKSFNTETQGGNSSVTENKINIANQSIELRRQMHFTHQIVPLFTSAGEAGNPLLVYAIALISRSAESRGSCLSQHRISLGLDEAIRRDRTGQVMQMDIVNKMCTYVCSCKYIG